MKRINYHFAALLGFIVMVLSSSAYADSGASDKFHVKRFVFEGNTVFSENELSGIAAAYTDRAIGYSDLEELRYKLTMLYVDKGYINSGVMIPDQKMTGSEIRMKVIEGRLSGMEITGNNWLSSGYIEKRIMLGAEPPLNMNMLQERLQMIQADPLVETVNSELKAGTSPGEAVLKVRVAESNPWNIGSEFSNSYPPGSGENILEAWVSHADVTGLGDTLWVQAGYIQNLSDYSGYYSIPFTAYDSRLKLSYSKTSNTLIEEPFDKIDIDSSSETYEIALSHPLIKTRSRELTLGLSGAKKYSETTLMNMPFSFSEGVKNGKCDISVLRFSQDWVSKDYFQVMSARSLFSLGINAFGATDNQSSPDGQFFTWIGQFQWVRQIEPLMSSQMIFKTNMQLSANPLLPPEKFAMGGSDSVRGYRENQLVRDNGFVTSLELRIPVLRLSFPGLSKTENDGRVYIAPFIDYARGWNTDRRTPDPWDISSIGAGLRYDPTSFIYSNIYWGFPLRDPQNPDNCLQDAGLHFMIGCRFI